MNRSFGNNVIKYNECQKTPVTVLINCEIYRKES